MLQQAILQKIYEIRGKRVMLDFDLAELYETETKKLNLAVRRNILRFPDDFMFRLTQEEWEEVLRFQNETSKTGRGGRRFLPYAFTEQGVAMLSGVLTSEKAIAVNISIMRAFIELKEFVISYADLKQRLDEFMVDTNVQFADIYQALTELASKKEDENKNRPRIGYIK